MIKKTVFVFFVMLCFSFGYGQLPKKKAIDLSVGYGLSVPYDDFDVTGEGFYFQGEYVINLKKWIDVRPYVGLILAKTNTGDDALPGQNFRSDAEGGLFGIKSRIRLPIPWVSPYFEFGIGGTVGTVVTFTPTTDLSESGLLFHIPISAGIELGPKNNFDLSFSYYFHPSVEQFSGAVAIGISIPIRQ